MSNTCKHISKTYLVNFNEWLFCSMWSFLSCFLKLVNVSDIEGLECSGWMSYAVLWCGFCYCAIMSYIVIQCYFVNLKSPSCVYCSVYVFKIVWILVFIVSFVVIVDSFGCSCYEYVLCKVWLYVCMYGWWLLCVHYIFWWMIYLFAQCNSDCNHCTSICILCFILIILNLVQAID